MIDSINLMALTHAGSGKTGYFIMYMLLLLVLSKDLSIVMPAKKSVPKNPVMVHVFPTNGLEEEMVSFTVCLIYLLAGLAARILEYGVDVEYICSCSDGVLGRPSGVQNQHWRISETTYLSCPLINLPTALACRFVRCTTPSSVFASFTRKVKYKKSANDQLVSLMASKM